MSKTVEWATPQALFNSLNKEFNFTLDPCSTDENAKCTKHYTQKDDGLAQDWSGERVFMNPPYGRVIGEWVAKASTGGADIVVCLLPARTDTRWFHDFIYGKAEVRFIRGRVKFGDGKQSAPFPSMIVIFRK
jgi:site-specific DNA-methyltransferase (adenine-specific)